MASYKFTIHQNYMHVGGDVMGILTARRNVEPVRRNPWVLITHDSGNKQYLHGNRVVEAVMPPVVQVECRVSVVVTELQGQSV